jgi:hypothetical protein
MVGYISLLVAKTNSTSGNNENNKNKSRHVTHKHTIIHALALTPKVPRLPEANSEASATVVPRVYALKMPQTFCKYIAMALHRTAGLSLHNSQHLWPPSVCHETNVDTAATLIHQQIKTSEQRKTTGSTKVGSLV